MGKRQKQGLSSEELTAVGDLLTLRYVPLSQVGLWERNPKVHDIPGIIGSMQRYGFQDPPKYDHALNEGQGGLVAGNGRVEALTVMQAEGQEPPLGIAVDKDSGEWTVPVIFGNDLPSQAAAEAFAIDHNNLTLAGGDFSSVYMTQMWDEAQYVALLGELGAEHLPVTVDQIDLEIMTEVMLGEETASEREDKGAKIRLGMYRFYIAREMYEVWEQALVETMGEDKEMIVAELKRRLGIEQLTMSN